MDQLPVHLKKYVVTQNYEKYTSIDQACWRYILRQLKDFLSQNAHECYLEGLEKTGIEIDRIPRIEDISKKLEKFGWRALPVSGFIPPAAFMELQSLGVLPIASDMRTLEHLSYTPAPDIVHEAAGHAPILVNEDFANYLKKYAEVAKHAIISKEDLDIYEAIRKLSDLKENPASTKSEIESAQIDLENLSKKISHVSEASELSRMNWWTAEYGLIGDLSAPKIFGAGLLSSVGESRWCLSSKVKKIPLSVDCIKQTYDITEPQPQLYVTPDFKTLSLVLEQMADQMAFRTGGASGLKKAIQAQSVNTAELTSGIQISGLISEYLEDKNHEIIYLKTSGPTQLCYRGQQIDHHSKSEHPHGFGTPVGYIRGANKRCLSTMTDEELGKLSINEGKVIEIHFESGVRVAGRLVSKTRTNNGLPDQSLLLLSLIDCTVTNTAAPSSSSVLFDPSWGTYDMAIGTRVQSVFGGPADRVAFGEIEDFPAHKVPTPVWSEEQKELQSIFSKIRDIRERHEKVGISSVIKSTIESLELRFQDEWLPRIELIELVEPKSDAQIALAKQLERIAAHLPQHRQVIEDGLRLALVQSRSH